MCLLSILQNFEPSLPLFCVGPIFISVNGQILRKQFCHLVALYAVDRFTAFDYIQDARIMNSGGRCYKTYFCRKCQCEEREKKFFLKKWANPGLFFIYFRLFKQTLKILQQISEKMFVLIHESAQNCENNERYL